MHDIVPLLGAMVVTIVLMFGLMRAFRRWMARRDEIMKGRG